MTQSKFVPLAILGFGILLVSGVRPQRVMSPRSPMKSIPVEMAGYLGHDDEVDADQRRVAGMSDYVLRIFERDSSVAFTVYVGYYDRQVQGKSIHSPRNCLPGAGWSIMESARVRLSTADSSFGNRVLLANGRARALVYYWYQGRGRIEPSEYRVKWDLLRDAALHGRTEESLVRIVLPLQSDGQSATPSAASIAHADSLASRIVPTLVPAVYSAMPAFPGV